MRRRRQPGEDQTDSTAILSKIQSLNDGHIHMQCVGVLSKSLGWRWQVHAERLIKPMKLTGLSEHLVQAYKVPPTSPQYAHTHGCPMPAQQTLDLHQ
jgi:hypothetical protein